MFPDSRTRPFPKATLSATCSHHGNGTPRSGEALDRSTVMKDVHILSALPVATLTAARRTARSFFLSEED